MSQSSHQGIFERLFSRPPLSAAIASIILFALIMSIFGSAALYSNEFDRFRIDYPAFSIALALSMMIYGEAFEGVRIRRAIDAIANNFNLEADSKKDYLDSVFNLPKRAVGGLISAAMFLVFYESFGFWYESPMLILIGRICAAFLGFVIGEVVVAAIFFIFKTRQIIAVIANQFDVLDYGKLKAIKSLSSASLGSSIAGSLVGFVALAGILAAPWRSSIPTTEISLLVLGGLFILLLTIFFVPITSIHRAMVSAKEGMEIQLSGMLKETNKKLEKEFAKGVEKIRVGDLGSFMDCVVTLEARVNTYPEWPFDFQQVMGALGSLGLVVFESILVILLSG